MARIYNIGRSPDSDIPIQDVSVSRKHAQLAFTDDGRCHLKDCDSTYGTFVFRDGRWEQVEQTVVELEDLLRFGSWQIKTAQIVKLLRAAEAMRQAQGEKTSFKRSRPQRRLAAILFADVVGYVRLMEAGEEETLERLKAHREELIDPTIAEFHGAVVKTMGDGVMTEFGSVLDAVLCAVEIQKGMSERNRDLPEGRRMLLRIGINLGDVVVEAGDIFGGGVNIASRLEGLAEPGGICISAAVYEQIFNKCDLRFDDLGKLAIKNAPEPVQVYSLQVAPSP
jgi:class 3 adenylate cyclase